MASSHAHNSILIPKSSCVLGAPLTLYNPPYILTSTLLLAYNISHTCHPSCKRVKTTFSVPLTYVVSIYYTINCNRTPPTPSKNIRYSEIKDYPTPFSTSIHNQGSIWDGGSEWWGGGLCSTSKRRMSPCYSSTPPPPRASPPTGRL